ncbi:MAG: hypothetical protein ACKOOD_00685, partial [Microbacteriaceae bacterium]
MTLKVLVELIKLYVSIIAFPAIYWIFVFLLGAAFGFGTLIPGNLPQVLGPLMVTGPTMIWSALASSPFAWLVLGWTAAGAYAQLTKKESLAEATPVVQNLLNPWYPSLIGLIVTAPLIYGAFGGFDFIGGINTILLCLA